MNFSKIKIFIDSIMPRPKGVKNSKRFEKSVKEIVHKELSEELEEKHAITDYNAIDLKRAIPSGVVLNGQGNFFQILPEIDQSLTGAAGRAYNTRIGNEINLKHIDITGCFNYKNSNASQTNYENAKIAVRVMILRAKEINDTDVLFDNMPTDTLIRFGEQTAAGFNGPTPFTGAPIDAWRDINRDTFAVRLDKVIYLDAPVILPGATQPDLSVVPSRSKLFKHRLSFGKGLKLKYSASTDVMPNNFPYFMVCGYSSMSGAGNASDNLATASLSCVGTYTDA